MSQVVEIRSSWKSLAGCLGTVALVIAAIVAIVVLFVKRSEDRLSRIDVEFLQPWFRAAREGEFESAWASLTTEAYRADNPEEAVAATYEEATRRFGRPVKASVYGHTGTKEPGSPYPLRTGTRWEWENGVVLHLVFHLVDLPGQGFRLEKAGLGELSRTNCCSFTIPPGKLSPSTEPGRSGNPRLSGSRESHASRRVASSRFFTCRAFQIS